MNRQPRHRTEKARSSRLVRATYAVVVLAVVALALTGFSSATFTSSTAAMSSVSAAADWTPPTVAVQSPGTVVKGATSVTATATDAGSGVMNVAIQYQAVQGSTWTTLCSDSTAPYTCAWSTTAVADGAYDLRAVATDLAGNTAMSATTRTTVANSLTVVLSSPGDAVRGTQTLTSTVSNAGGLTPSVRVEYAAVGSSTWTTICTDSASPYTCSWATAALANGTYDLRSVATVGGATYTSATVRTIVDNLAPTVTMTNPGSPLTGTKTFAATAADTHSGVDQVVIEYTTGTTWATLCTITAAPYSCSYDTTKLANGTYSFRAVATDLAGNTTTSAAVTGRSINNVISTVSLVDPGTYLRGTVNLTANATSNTTIASVRFQTSAAGTGSWIDVCTDTVAPYTCSVYTGGGNDGLWDVRAVLTDSAGRTTTSAVLEDRIVDNTPGRGIDIKTTNGGTAGKIDTGDTISYTYSEKVNLGTVLSGWDGSAKTVSIRVRDGLNTGGTSTDDLLDVTSPTGVNLGTVDLDANFVTRSTLTIAATMTATTDTSGRTVVTLRITQSSASNTVTTAGTMVWTPSASVTDLAGNPTSTSATSETGTWDRDF
jgi:hypothetical protein